MKKAVVIFVSLVLLILFLQTQVAEFSGPSKEPYKVGVLVANDLRLVKVEALKSRLEELGLIEGEGIVYDIRNAENDLSKLAELGKELLVNKADVLVASGAVEALSLKELTLSQKGDKESPTPVIFMGTLSPSAIGLVEDTAFPGSNLTGLNNYHYELTPKRLELLHRLLPDLNKVAVLGDSRVPIFEQTQKELLQGAQEMGLEISIYTITNQKEVDEVFGRIEEAKEEAIVLLPGFFLESQTREIVHKAMELKIPVFGVYP